MNRSKEEQERDIYLKKLKKGEIFGPLVGKPSVDKPWLKYYEDKSIMSDVPKKTLYEYVKDSNLNNLNRTAINYFDIKITYEDLFYNIEQVSKSLLNRGVKKGDMVSIISPTTPEVIYLFYALSNIGAVANVIDPRASQHEIEDFINESKSELLFIVESGEYINKLDGAAKNSCVKEAYTIDPLNNVPIQKKLKIASEMIFDKNSDATFKQKLEKIKFERPSYMKSWDEFYDYSKEYTYNEEDYPGYEPDKVVVLVHTGGTTGKPKGVMLTNDNLNATVYQSIESGYDFKKEDKWLNIMPIFIAYGAGNGLHLPLVKGMEVVVISQFNPNKLAQLYKKYNFQHMTGVPEHFDNLIDAKVAQKLDFSNAKSLIMGGDKASEKREVKKNEWLEEHNCPHPISKGYGMTEVAAATCATSFDEVNKIGSVGTPFAFTNFGIFKQSNDPNHIYDENDELRYYEEGEICMEGPNTMLGYLNNEEENNKVIKIHKDNKRWVHSGDLGYIDEDGCLFFKDRNKNMIALNSGFKIYPDKIEKVIMNHPNISDCKVVGIQDPDSYQGMRPLVFVVSNKESLILTTQLEQLCKEKLPDYSQPIDFVVKDSFPLTKIGKINQIQLLEEYKEQNQPTNEVTRKRKNI